jgi:hypothetical protein
LISPKFFIHQQMQFLLILGNSQIYIKTCVKIAATCFDLRPSSGSLHLSLAKVTLILKQSVKLRRYVLCGGVAALFSGNKLLNMCVLIFSTTFVCKSSRSKKNWTIYYHKRT